MSPASYKDEVVREQDKGAKINMPPCSCDTFVVLPPLTRYGFVIFGKNSDRPAAEVQEVVFCPARDHPPSSKVRCTYIEIDQANHTHSVILSKPSWMWGAEMGANEHGVVIGNEAVWTKLNSDEDKEERLLGMDLLRLGLERGATAQEALQTITQMLENYGQGGMCSDEVPMTYHNSFLIADRTEAWVLETAKKSWVAEKVQGGSRNISNCLSISSHIDLMSGDLLGEKNGASFDFCAEFANKMSLSEPRFETGKKLLQQYTADGQFDIGRMMQILRDKPSGICKPSGDFVTTASQISVIPQDPNIPAVHFFTATPDPCVSGFKPFVFAGSRSLIPPFTISPVFPDDQDPAKVRPRFARKVDRRHSLYKLHQELLSKASVATKVVEGLRTLENEAVDDITEALSSSKPIPDAENLFVDAVEAEIQLYKSFSYC